MNNLNDLKEQLQEDVLTWSEENSNNIDTLCDIIIKRVNELKKTLCHTSD